MEQASGEANTVFVSSQELAELREAVKDRLQRLGVQDRLKGLIEEQRSSDSAPEKQQVVQKLKEQGYADELVHALASASDLHGMGKERLKDTRAKQKAGQPSQHVTVQDRQLIRLRISTLSGFTDLPAEESILLCGELFGQQFRSTSVSSQDVHRLELTAMVEMPGEQRAQPHHLLHLRQPLHLVMVSMPHADKAEELHLCGERRMVGVASCEWRHVLVARNGNIRLHASIVMPGRKGTNSADICGTLAVDLQVLPQLEGHEPLPAGAIGSQLEAEQRRDQHAAESFTLRAKNWWTRYTMGKKQAVRERLVKVLAFGEDGVRRPSCTFIKPMQLGRCLASPLEAARFVALLELREEDAEAALGGPTEAWATLHSIVSTGAASQEEKALLLCGLLLGFALDAWVCVGRDLLGGHMWVLTRNSASSVTFWEPSTGQRLPSSSATHSAFPYVTLDSIFNHRRVYANAQADNAVASTSYAFEQASQWDELVVEKEDAVGAPWVRFELQMAPLDVPAAEARLEAQLKQQLAKFRSQRLGLGAMAWDDNLGFLLMPALAGYEYEAVTGQPMAGAEGTQRTLRNVVRSGYAFQAYPLHSRSMSVRDVMPELLREARVQDMLRKDVPETVFALRVKMTPYPAGMVSTWVMLGMKCLA